MCTVFFPFLWCLRVTRLGSWFLTILWSFFKELFVVVLWKILIVWYHSFFVEWMGGTWKKVYFSPGCRIMLLQWCLWSTSFYYLWIVEENLCWNHCFWYKWKGVLIRDFFMCSVADVYNVVCQESEVLGLGGWCPRMWF